MKNIKAIECKGMATAALTLMLTGCASFNSPVAPAPVKAIAAAVQGKVFGGQQPIAGAALALYAASTSGYAGTNTNLLTTAYTTDASGNFNIGTTYNCSAGQQIYIVATGGNPGGGVNNSAALMAALGDCANLNNIPNVVINELTTVASAYALSPFMTGTTQVGTSATNTAGLARAFASVNKLVNITNGQSANTSVPAGTVIPTAELNTLADILAACINTASSGSTPSASCASLFSNTTANGVTPTDTIGAALAIARNPGNNIGALYSTVVAASPFQPTLAVQPNDFTVAIAYKPAGLQAPSTVTIDGNGQVWLASPAANKVTVLAQTGAPVNTLTGLNGPAAVAIDASGNAWIANKTGNSLSTFSNAGAALGTYTAAGNLSAPSALAFDAAGNVWVANSSGNSLTELSSGGSFIQQVTGVAAPGAIVINTK